MASLGRMEAHFWSNTTLAVAERREKRGVNTNGCLRVRAPWRAAGSVTWREHHHANCNMQLFKSHGNYKEMGKELSLHSLKAFTVATQIITSLAPPSHSVSWGESITTLLSWELFIFSILLHFPELSKMLHCHQRACVHTGVQLWDTASCGDWQVGAQAAPTATPQGRQEEQRWLRSPTAEQHHTVCWHLPTGENSALCCHLEIKTLNMFYSKWQSELLNITSKRQIQKSWCTVRQLLST